MPILDNINNIKSNIPTEVELVAVSKFQPTEALAEAYRVGQRIFAESRPQEMFSKWQTLSKDIQWHFIGHLQTNKVPLIAPFVALIHSVDSERLLATLSKEAVKIGRTLKVLLEVHVAQEQTKQGFSATEVCQILDRPTPDGIEIVGLMGMASFTEDETQLRSEFTTLKSLFDQYPSLTTLSMGMSNDYRLAIECGSNMVRIGSAIFGSRE